MPVTAAWRRNLAGSAAVAVGVGVLSLGMPALDDAIPDATVPAGRPLPFAANVSVVPPPDATLDAESTSPAQGVVTLFVDGVRYRLSAQAFAGTVDQLAARVRAQVGQATGLQGIAADQPITTDAGVPGETAAFVAENRTGWYAVFVHDGTGVVAVVDGNDASLTGHRGDLDKSVRSLTFQDET
jgi:hypothetical protein